MAVSLGQDNWPAWWQWDVVLTGHMRESMQCRGLNEVDVRQMLQWGTALKPDPVAGRWRVSTRHARVRWIVVVEPNSERQLLEAVTVYPLPPRTP